MKLLIGIIDWATSPRGDPECRVERAVVGARRRVSVAQTSTAAYACYAAILSRTAALLGRNALERKYGALARDITEAFNRENLDPLTALYGISACRVPQP